MIKNKVIILIFAALFTCGLSPGAKERLKEIRSEESDTSTSENKEKTSNKKNGKNENKENKTETPVINNPGPGDNQNPPQPRGSPARKYENAQENPTTGFPKSNTPVVEEIKITINTFTENARVFINGSYVCDSIVDNYNCLIRLVKKNREIEIKLEKDNIKPVRFKLKTDRDRQIFVDFYNPGTFLFKSNPGKAHVIVDNVELGMTPCETYEINPRMIHNVMFSLGINTKEFLYVPGDSKTMEADLNYGSLLINLPENGMEFIYSGVKHRSGSVIRSFDNKAKITVDLFGYKYTEQVIPVKKKTLEVINVSVPKIKPEAELFKVNNARFNGEEIEISGYYEMQVNFSAPCRVRVEIKNMDDNKTYTLAKNWNVTTDKNTLYWNAQGDREVNLEQNCHYEMCIINEADGSILYCGKVKFARTSSNTPFVGLTGEPGLAFAADFEVPNKEDCYFTGRAALLYSEEEDGAYSFCVGNYGYYLSPNIGRNMQLGISGNILNIDVPGSSPLFKIDAKLVGSLQLFKIGRKNYCGSALHVRYSFGEEINPDDQPIKYSKLSSKPELLLSCGFCLGGLKFMGNASREGRVALGASFRLSSKSVVALSVQRIYGVADIPAAVEFSFTPARKLSIGPSVIFNFFRNDSNEIESFYLLGFNFRYAIDY